MAMLYQQPPSLQTAVNHFVATPTEANMDSAKAAWVAARHPYQQTEAYRFGNAIVDDWEGKVNAWPLDEGLIDYVATSYGAESDENPFYSANIIANTQLTIGGVEVDASTIDKAFYQKLCMRLMRSKVMWQRAIMRSNFCFGGKI